MGVQGQKSPEKLNLKKCMFILIFDNHLLEQEQRPRRWQTTSAIVVLARLLF